MGGYWTSGLPGFIVGLAAGPAASHLFLLPYLPIRPSAMLWQSVRFTILTGLVGLAAVGGTLWLRTVTTTPVWMVTVVLTALSPLLVASWIAYRRIWHASRPDSKKNRQ